MPITLRPSEPADILAMYQLDLLCFEAPFRFDLESMHYFATRPRSICLIAESAAADDDAADDDAAAIAAIAGFVIVNLSLRRKVSSGYVTTLDVHPDFRRQGLARQLMQTAETSAIHADVTFLRLHVSAENEPAISFYESIGFTRQLLAENFYAEGLHAWFYTKPLPAN